MSHSPRTVSSQLLPVHVLLPKEMSVVSYYDVFLPVPSISCKLFRWTLDHYVRVHFISGYSLVISQTFFPISLRSVSSTTNPGSQSKLATIPTSDKVRVPCGTRFHTFLLPVSILRQLNTDQRPISYRIDPFSRTYVLFFRSFHLIPLKENPKLIVLLAKKVEVKHSSYLSCLRKLVPSLGW